MVIWTRVVTALFLLALFAIVPIASADQITWTLSGGASGSFVYDATTNIYSSINITVTGESFGDGTYTMPDPGFPSSSIFLLPVQGPSTNFTGARTPDVLDI